MAEQSEPGRSMNDGYGDTPTVDEALADYDAWLHARVHRMLAPTDHRHDDLVQEGRIAMWRALQRHDPAKGGALPDWLTRHATWRMLLVLSREDQWTGRPPKPRKGGAKGDAARARIAGLIRTHRQEHGCAPTLRQLSERTGLSSPTVHFHLKRLYSAAAPDAVAVPLDDASEADLATPDIAGEAMLAYHRGEIAQALDRLTETQRHYVRMRFWEGASETELREEFGYDPTGVWSRPDRARDALATALSHLRDAA